MPARDLPRHSLRSRLLVGASIAGLAFGGMMASDPAKAGTYTVTNTNASGAGSLEQAITSANTAGGSNTITFSNTLAGQTLMLTGALSPITSNITIDGSGAPNLTISGANTYQIFQVGTVGSNTALAVAVENVNLIDGKATGSNGGSAGSGGGGGGGGGLGAGGAIAVLSGNSSLTVTNVAFNGNNATGGAGGSLSGASTTGGTGGGVNGGTGAAGGSSGTAGSVGTTLGQGGGGGGNGSTSATGGSGALGGGGGGGGGGAGYTPGGGGGTYGGGGGYGTAGSVGAGGGGGAGLGGAVFVVSTSTVTFDNVSSGTVASNTTTGGAGGTANPPSATNGGSGTGIGAALFTQSGATFTGTGTIANDIAGTGGATINGAGNVTFTAANSFAGGTTITAGSTLNLSGTGTLLSTGAVEVDTGSTFNIASATSAETIGDLSGAGAVTLGSHGLTAGTTNSTTYSGVMSGTGGFTKAGSGTLTFSGVNTYSGGTTVNAGTLALSGTSSLGSGVVLLTTGTTLDISAASSTQAIGPLAGAGNVTLGANTLSIGGALNTSYTGVISGTGGITMAGSGTLTLSGANTYTGATTFQGGIVSIATHSALSANTSPMVFDGGALQSTATIAPYSRSVTLQSAGGTIDTENASTLTLNGVVSGSGALSKIGNGTLTLGGANTYSGGTSVSAGTLALAANNAAGTGTLFVATGATVSLGNSSQTVTALGGGGTITATGGTLTSTATDDFSGTITSTGSLVIDGSTFSVGHGYATSSLQVLNGTSSFANTTVSAGSLEIGDAEDTGATLTSPVTVSSGGTLLGHGSIIGNVSSNGGTVQPGGTIGTLVIHGNYSQAANSTLAIELSPTASSLLAVGGTASLAGTLALLPDTGTYAYGKEYTIVSAAEGLTGTFSTVTDSNPGVGFTETYTPTAVDLTVTSGAPPATATKVVFAEGNLTPNEANATGAIEAILPGTSAGAFQSGLIGLGMAPGSTGQTAALAGVLGELRADIATIDLANLTAFQNFIVERMDSRMGQTGMTQVNNGLPGTFDVAQNGYGDMPLFGGGPNGLLSVDQPSMWMHGYGVLGQAGGETGFQDFQYQTGGLVAGVDARVTDTTLLGAALGYEHTDFHLSGDVGESNTIDTYRVTVYGSQALDDLGLPVTADAALGYAFNDYHDNDGFSAPGFGLTQTSRHDGNELTAEAGLGHGFEVPQDAVEGTFSLTPRVGIEYDNIQQNPYATTGASAPGLNLSASGSTLNALRSTIGAHADLKLTTGDGTVITPEIRASYLHDFMDTNVPLTQAFAGAPAAGFTVTGVHPGRDAALAGAGVNVGFSQALSATIGYDAAVRTHETDNTIQVGMKYKW